MAIATLFFAEGALELGFWCSICTVQMRRERWIGGSEAFSSSLMTFTGMCLIIAPIYLFIIGRKLHKAFKEGDTETVEKYSPIFDGKRFSDPHAIQYTVVFLLRRYFLIWMIVFVQHLTVIQVLGFLYSSTLMLAYVLHAKPYETPQFNRVELFNEFCVYLSGWLMLLQTDVFDFSLETRYQIGWSHIGLAMLVILVSVVIMLVDLIRNCKLSCIKCSYKKAQRTEQ